MELKQHEINQLLEQLETSKEAQNSPIYKKLKEEQVRTATANLFDIPGSDYWIVMHDPDLTEGKCYYAMDFVITQWTGFPAQKSCQKELVEDYCSLMYGSKVEFVMGVAPMLNWYVRSADKNEFMQRFRENQKSQLKPKIRLIHLEFNKDKRIVHNNLVVENP